MIRKTLSTATLHARKVVVAVVGATVVLLGVVMIVLPGPALLVIPLGLGILAAEFAFARRWLARLRERGDRLWDGLRGRDAWQR